MKRLKFKCTLLSDVILNQKAATEGPNQTLDFIPGSNFLGIVAGKLYPKLEPEESLMIFHSGKVRFGDAHPSYGEMRSLKIPASMFYPKLKKASDECYIHHLIPPEQLERGAFKKKQIKQCRTGFYLFDKEQANEVKAETNFAIKSAYDKEKRRSKDEQMFGYESLQKDLELCFEVEVDDEALAETVKKALVGKDKRIGRSRSAQYGLVSIEEFDFTEQKSKAVINDEVTVYADGRLIFLDEFGLPTFCPTAKQLGFSEKDKILWDKSQIRTFQYAPWNSTRQCFDTDRCGIEKGSVFVVKTIKKDFESQYVGSYQNEGFGKVIYNPEFLKAQKEFDKELRIETEGHAVYKIIEKQNDEHNPTNIIQEIENLENAGMEVCKYLASRKRDEYEKQIIYKTINDFVSNKEQGGLFTNKGEKFASQWGHIRSIAMQEKDYDKLYLKLFGSKDNKDLGYLTHGIAAEKWENKRINVVRKFFGSIKEIKLEHRISEAMVNLSAEMAKEMRRKEERNDNN